MSAPNAEALAGGAAQGPEDQTKQSADSVRREQRIARLQAALALHGFELVVSDEHGGAIFIVSRWGLAKELPDLSAAETFAAQVGAP